jgi:hypothetical protein
LADELALHCGDVRVAFVQAEGVCERTWEGRYRLAFAGTGKELMDRLAAFVAFCVDWHCRLDASTQDVPDPSEFDAYDDLISREDWYLAPTGGAVRRPLTGAPTFHEGGWAYWIYREEPAGQ